MRGTRTTSLRAVKQNMRSSASASNIGTPMSESRGKYSSGEKHSPLRPTFSSVSHQLTPRYGRYCAACSQLSDANSRLEEMQRELDIFHQLEKERKRDGNDLAKRAQQAEEALLTAQAAHQQREAELEALLAEARTELRTLRASTDEAQKHIMLSRRDSSLAGAEAESLREQLGSTRVELETARVKQARAPPPPPPR